MAQMVSIFWIKLRDFLLRIFSKRIMNLQISGTFAEGQSYVCNPVTGYKLLGDNTTVDNATFGIFAASHLKYFFAEAGIEGVIPIGETVTVNFWVSDIQGGVNVVHKVNTIVLTNANPDITDNTTLYTTTRIPTSAMFIEVILSAGVGTQVLNIGVQQFTGASL